MIARSFPPTIRPGLERMHRALDLLGHPEENFASLLVGGTNGKGSVSALIASGLREAGYRPGLYTSPHLVAPHERARFSGEAVAPSAWREAMERVAALNARHRLRLTEFEAQTLAAFGLFAEAAVDLAVLEVGLGGRLDAVNAVAAPELSLITSIALDHTAWLGPTRRHIYREKRGIARPGTPLLQAIPAFLWPEARRFSAQESVPTWTLGQEIFWEVDRRSGNGQFVHVRLPTRDYRCVPVPLWGPHQAANGALAVAALDTLARRGWRIREEHIRRGLAQARWPGRFEVVRRRPPVVLDGAHNPAAAEALAAAWKAGPWGEQRVTLIFSCLRDKDLLGLRRALAPLVRRVIVTALPGERARPVAELAAAWRRFFPTEETADFAAAWRRARRDPSAPVLVTGSLYLVGEAMKLLKRDVDLSGRRL